MALILCPECQHQVSDLAIMCPGCGYPIQEDLHRLIVQMLTDNEKLLYNAKDVQRILGTGSNLTYDLVHYGGLPAITINGRIYFSRKGIEQWVSRHMGKQIELADMKRRITRRHR